VELHVESNHRSISLFKTPVEVSQFIHEKLEYLKTSRPTAVNLFEAADRLDKLVQSAAASALNPAHVVSVFIEAAEEMMDKDLKDNYSIGSLGADFILSNSKQEAVQILTHCNTGSLATSGWGTALGMIRELKARNLLSRAFCTETRPYNQGSRLTAYELVYESIPATLICDNMVSALLKDAKIDAIVVGADR
jgi:methylthioribose-1-phosphate isomerase